jgi:hypothetical protein
LWERSGTQKYTVWAHYVSDTEPNWLMLFGKTVAVYYENHTEHTDTLCGQNAEYIFNVKSFTVVFLKGTLVLKICYVYVESDFHQSAEIPVGMYSERTWTNIRDCCMRRTSCAKCMTQFPSAATFASEL